MNRRAASWGYQRFSLRACITFVAVLVACVGSYSTGDVVGEVAAPEEVARLRGLAEIWGMAYYFHPLLVDPQKQSAWENELLKAIPEVDAAETAEEYAMALQRMIAKLGDGGTTVLFSDEINERGEPDSSRLPIRLVSVDGKAVISAIDFDAPGTESLEVGMEVLSIDGTPVNAYLSEWICVASGRTKLRKQDWVFQRLLAGEPGSEAKVLVRTALDAPILVELERPSDEYWSRITPTLRAEDVDGERFIHVALPSVRCSLDRTPGIYTLYELSDRFNETMEALDTDGVILDLRAGGKEFGLSFFVDIPLPHMLARFIEDPWTVSAGHGQRMHEGLKDPVLPMLSHPYGEYWVVREGAPFDPSFASSDCTPLVVLVDAGSYSSVVEYLAPLQASGRAVIVGEFGTEPMRQSYACSLPGGLGFQLRLSIPWDGDGAVHLPLVEVSPSIDALRDGRDVALETATSILDDWESRATLSVTTSPGIGALSSQLEHASQSSLAYEERLLGLFKLWNAIRYFHPFPELIDAGWDETLGEFIPRVIEAADSHAYYHELQHMLARTNDGHAFLGVGFPGQYRPSIEIREIEGEAVIASIDQQGIAEPGLELIEVGMIVTEVNGRSVDQLIEERLRWVPGATDQHRRLQAFQQLLTGSASTEVSIGVADSSSEGGRTVLLSRTGSSVTTNQTPPFRWLNETIAFIDLTRINNAEFDQAMREFRDANGILIDLRGYPHFVGAGLVLDFLTDRAAATAQYHVPLVYSPDADQRGWKQMTERMGPMSIESFKGDIVVLANACTVSAAESMLFPLLGSDRIVIVGEPTAGTTGNNTHVEIPGRAYASFTGLKVLHGDGSPFQGIGIIPDVEVYPTIQGIRDGRDEVLEKGLAVLQDMIERRNEE